MFHYTICMHKDVPRTLVRLHVVIFSMYACVTLLCVTYSCTYTYNLYHMYRWSSLIVRIKKYTLDELLRERILSYTNIHDHHFRGQFFSFMQVVVCSRSDQRRGVRELWVVRSELYQLTNIGPIRPATCLYIMMRLEWVTVLAMRNCRVCKTII